MVEVHSLIAQLNGLGESLSSGAITLTKPESAALVDACQRLVDVAEDPMQKLFKLTFDASFLVDPFAAIRVAMKMGIIDAVVKSGQPSYTAVDLAKWTKADPLLIVRIMRILVHSRLFKEIGPSEYAAYPHTGLLASGSPLGDTMIHSFDIHAKILIYLPEFLESTGFQNPNIGNKGPFQYAFNTSDRFYDWLDKRPERNRILSSMMEMLRKLGLEQWFTYFPIKDRLSSVADRSEPPVLVDLGGREGTELRNLKAYLPDLKCKFVVEDMAETIALAKAKEQDPDISLVVANLLEEQPVKHATIYFMSKILHNWPDSEARQILVNTARAMSPKSLLLLNDIVLPERDVSLVHAFIDLTMMAEFSSLERTEKQWRELLSSAGLEIVKIWEPTRKVPGWACLIEARLKQ